MYATEKYVRFEAKELQNQINTLSSDLHGDIRSLYQEILDLKELVAMLQHEIEIMRDNNGKT
jgi:hypothetical protein